MSRWALLLAEIPYQASESDALVSYRFGRVEQFDDPRLLWAGVVIVSALLALFVAWQYRRESSALPRGRSVVLAGLRLLALAGAVTFFLTPMKRTDQQVVTDSRVAVLVDASQSMNVEDEQAGDETGLSRSEVVLRTLREEPFIAQLREQHDVTVAVFDAELRRIAQWKRSRTGAAQDAEDQDKESGDSTPSAKDEPSVDALTPAFAEQLKPIGAETRLGDALSAILNDQSGKTSASIHSPWPTRPKNGRLRLSPSASARRTPVETCGSRN
jgi:hypothetical protein